jgi:hypothetical protein
MSILISRKIWIGLACLTALLTTGCTHHSQASEMTQLQIREIQTRTFLAKDAKSVLKEMFNVLQDDAYIVKNANVELGFLTGEKDIDLEEGWVRALSIFAHGNNATWKKNAIIEISANVTQFGSDTRVRINIQKKLFDNFGRVLQVRQIYDASEYQAFFDKVQKGLFIEEQQL